MDWIVSVIIFIALVLIVTLIVYGYRKINKNTKRKFYEHIAEFLANVLIISAILLIAGYFVFVIHEIIY